MQRMNAVSVLLGGTPWILPRSVPEILASMPVVATPQRWSEVSSLDSALCILIIPRFPLFALFQDAHDVPSLANYDPRPFLIEPKEWAFILASSLSAWLAGRFAFVILHSFLPDHSFRAASRNTGTGLSPNVYQQILLILALDRQHWRCLQAKQSCFQKWFREVTILLPHVRKSQSGLNAVQQIFSSPARIVMVIILSFIHMKDSRLSSAGLSITTNSFTRPSNRQSLCFHRLRSWPAFFKLKVCQQLWLQRPHR